MARSLVATEIGVKRAKEALIDLGMNQTILVKSLELSRATVSKFFGREPIAHENFTKICKKLKLEWRDITGKVEEEPMKGVELTETCSQANIDTISMAMSARNKPQRYYPDTNSIEEKPLVSFVIAGTLDQVDQRILTVIVELLRQKTSDISIAIVDIQEGSIKLILTGTPEALEMIQSLYRSGELTEVEGIPIENVELLVDKHEIAKKQNTINLRSDLSEQFGNHPRMKVVEFNAGEKFFLMLVPNGSVEEAWNALDQGTTQNVRPLFSLVTASPNEAIQMGQIIDITGDGNTFVMEDMRVDQLSDHDYNDLIFQIKGATINAATLDDLISIEEMQPKRDWRSTKLGQVILEYTESFAITAQYGSKLFFRMGKHQKSPSIVPVDFEINQDMEITAEAEDDLPEPELEAADTALEVAEIFREEVLWDPVAMEEIEVEEVLEDLITDSCSLNFEQSAANNQGEETSVETTTETESEKTAIVAEVDDTDEGTESTEVTDEDTEDILVDTPLLLSDVVGGLGTVTDPSGKLSVIWNFDGGAYEGQVGIVSTDGSSRAEYSSYGYSLDIVSSGKTLENEVIGSMVDTANIDNPDLVVENGNSDLFSQVISGYYTVEATGKVEFQFIADVSNYRGQLAVVSMTGMENLDINSREFLQEALDRAIFGSEEKLGYIINEID